MKKVDKVINWLHDNERNYVNPLDLAEAARTKFNVHIHTSTRLYHDTGEMFDIYMCIYYKRNWEIIGNKRGMITFQLTDFKCE